MSDNNPKTDSKIFIACPWTPLGGGMFKVADYLIQNQHPEQVTPENRATLLPLDTRGEKGAFGSLFYLTGALFKLLFARIRGQVSGVHVNMAERLSLFRKSTVVVFSRLIGIKVILHLHAAQLHHFYKKLPAPLKWWTRWSFSRANLVVVLGENAKKFVKDDLRVPEEKIHIILNGVPEPIFDRQPYSKTHDKVRVMFLGNLSERKGVSDLLDAISQSKAFQNDQAEAIIVGSGEVDFYQNKAKKLKVDQHVTFTGWADQKQAAEWMSTADILTLPSYDEGLPLVILEALGNGVAVSCTPVGEIAFNLTHDQNAVFTEPGDNASLAAALDKLILDQAYRERIAQAGRQLYEQGFSIDAFADSVAETHQKVFGKTSRDLHRT